MAAGAWPGYQSLQVFPVSADLSPYRRCLASRGTRNVLGPQKQQAWGKACKEHGWFPLLCCWKFHPKYLFFYFWKFHFRFQITCACETSATWKMLRFCYQNQVTLAHGFFLSRKKQTMQLHPSVLWKKYKIWDYCCAWYHLRHLW